MINDNGQIMIIAIIQAQVYGNNSDTNILDFY